MPSVIAEGAILDIWRVILPCGAQDNVALRKPEAAEFWMQFGQEFQAMATNQVLYLGLLFGLRHGLAL